ncbi:hypothetical protein [Peptoanaerobacter stomatis]
MMLELSEEQARLLKESLNLFVFNKPLWEERYEEYKYLLGVEKGQEVTEKIFSEVKQLLEKFDEVQKLDETYGYEMGLVNIVCPDIYSHILSKDMREKSIINELDEFEI